MTDTKHPTSREVPREPVDIVAVIQSDRDAAADAYLSHYGPGTESEKRYRAGDYDNLAYVQAFARYRRAASPTPMEQG